MNHALAKKINSMAREDQKVRAIHEADRSALEEVDRKHTRALKEIIKNHGWPTIRMVGKKANFNAWLLAQHADHDRAFQKRVLKLLAEQEERSEKTDKKHIAYLTDRILVADKKKQKFGTQFKFTKNKNLKPYPLANRKGIDSLRAQYGLPPLRDFLKMATEFNAKNQTKHRE